MLTTADLTFFATIARTPSLAAAARVLDVTPSAVTQRLQELERRVGVRLLERRGRRPTLTAEGELLATRGQAIGDELEALAEALAQRRGVVAGHLRVLAPFGFGRRYIAPVAAAFCRAHPDITLDLALSESVARVPDHSWDVAVHIGGEPHHSLRAEQLAPNARWLVASPAYVAQHGAPETPDALRSARCIALRENDEDVTLWRFTDGAGRTTQVRVRPALASNDGDVVREWALAGEGVIVRSEWSVHDDVAAGRLVRLLPDFALPAADVVAFVGARRGRSARTTAFVARLRDAFQRVPWRT
ncbi:MAG: LysR family transcriptional regulator [Gemmatimonadetes bacterium]|nr:LysR family transcriptional regulator [Gemmatimonadota bacterium]